MVSSTPSLPDGLTLRPVTSDDWPTYHRAIERTFLGDTYPELSEREKSIFEFDRALGVFDGAKPVGTIAAYSLQMTLPGGLRPLAGVSQVSVQPTHRRRGIMRAMMTQGLHDLHERGDEAVAALWATEGSIYGRFGFGVASTSFTVTIKRGEGAFLPGVSDREGSFEMLEAEAAIPSVSEIFDEQLPEQVGAVARDEVWWRARVFDPTRSRGKAGPLLTVIHRDSDGALDGYALYRTEPGWEGANPDGRVEVKEIVGRTPSATAALWRYLLDIDLAGETYCWNVALDDPLLRLMADPRRARATSRDVLSVRLVDVPRALSERTYQSEADVVLDVYDPTCDWNAGTWRVRTGAEGASCERTTASADLSLDVRELGALHLGGVSMGALARAGLVTEHRPGALREAARAWSHPADQRRPFCPMVF